MKNRVPYYCDAFITGTLFLNTACTHNFAKTKNEPTSNQPSTTLTDRDSNSYTTKIMLDNKQWMAANLNVKMPESYCHDALKIDLAAGCNRKTD